MTSLVADSKVGPGPPDQSISSTRRPSKGGRKLVKAETTAGGGGGEKNLRPVDITDIDDLQKILDRDADAIVNMKRDITTAQKGEVEKAKLKLLKCQKEYDAKKIENKRKQLKLNELLDKQKELERLQSVRNAESSQKQSVVQTLKRNISVIEEKLAADKRTFGVMALMNARLQSETEQLRSESQLLSQQLDIKKTELLGLNSTIRSSKQELMEEEKKYEDLVKLVKSRAQQRMEKMSQLQSIMLLNGSLLDSAALPENQVTRYTLAQILQLIRWYGNQEGNEEVEGEYFSKLFVRGMKDKVIPPSRGTTSDTTDTRDRDVPVVNKEQVLNRCVGMPLT